MQIRPIHTFQVGNIFPVESGVSGNYPLYVKHGFIVFRVTRSNRKPSFGFLTLLDPERPEMILPHEQVIPTKVDSKVAEAQAESFSIKPVCLLHVPMERLTGHLIAGFEKGKVIASHTQGYWLYEYAIFDDAIWADQLTELFADQKSLVIADGHHRTAAYFAIRQDSDDDPGLFSAIMSLDQVEVHSYHRKIRIKKEYHSGFYELLEKMYEVTDLPTGQDYSVDQWKCSDDYTIVMRTRKGWSRLRPVKGSSSIRPGSADLLVQFEEEILDVFCRDNSLEPHDLMEFISGSEFDLDELQPDANDFLFLFPPVSHEFLWASSLRGEILPAKSTWIEPRMPSNIIQVPNTRE